MIEAIEEARQEGIEEAPFLSLYEAVRYTQIDLTSLRQFLDFHQLGQKRINRKALDSALSGSAHLLKAWQAGYWKKFRGATLFQILKKGRLH